MSWKYVVQENHQEGRCLNDRHKIVDCHARGARGNARGAKIIVSQSSGPALSTNIGMLHTVGKLLN